MKCFSCSKPFNLILLKRLPLLICKKDHIVCSNCSSLFQNCPICHLPCLDERKVTYTMKETQLSEHLPSHTDVIHKLTLSNSSLSKEMLELHRKVQKLEADAVVMRKRLSNMENCRLPSLQPFIKQRRLSLPVVAHSTPPCYVSSCHVSLKVPFPPNVSTFLYSPYKKAFDRVWRIVVQFSPSTDEVSFHLVVDRTICDSYLLEFLLHSSLPNTTKKRSADHVFTSTIWGYDRFVSFSQLSSSLSPYVNAEEIHFEVKTSPSKVDTSFSSNDARVCHSFIGLKNNDNTSYLNVLLQCLFHTSLFRNAVLSIPNEEGSDPHDSLSLALQRFFLELSTSKQSLSTTNLKLFLDLSESRTTRDCFNSICNSLKSDTSSFKSEISDITRQENLITKLFQWQLCSYTKYVDVDYESSQVKTFYDLSLEVKGCSNIYESFEKYPEDKILEGNNRYFTKKQGAQETLKEVKFKSFPPILVCHLKRFEYDFHTDNQVKINDKYEFYSEISLDDCLEDGADRTIDQKFLLHSVLVHSGDVDGGHHYAFIRPSLLNKSWFMFDDEVVEKVDAVDAIEGNFGGQMTMTTIGGVPDNEISSTLEYRARGNRHQSRHQSPASRRVQRCGSAYMLVYIRESDYDDVMNDVIIEL
ncbi:hypothetical protein GEMRC1_008296 [Eukaryota sp. GEM-RC1]